MEHCRSPDGVTSVSVRCTTQFCRAFTLALARLSCFRSFITLTLLLSYFTVIFNVLYKLLSYSLTMYASLFVNLI